MAVVKALLQGVTFGVAWLAIIALVRRDFRHWRLRRKYLRAAGKS